MKIDILCYYPVKYLAPGLGQITQCLSTCRKGRRTDVFIERRNETGKKTMTVLREDRRIVRAEEERKSLINE